MIEFRKTYDSLQQFRLLGNGRKQWNNMDQILVSDCRKYLIRDLCLNIIYSARYN